MLSLFLHRKNVTHIQNVCPLESTDTHGLYDKQALSHSDGENEPKILMMDDWGFRHVLKKILPAFVPWEKISDQSESLTVLIDGVCVTCCWASGQTLFVLFSQSLSCHFSAALTSVDWNIHSAALATLQIIAYFHFLDCLFQKLLTGSSN